MGKTLPYDAHPKFKHDYTEQWISFNSGKKSIFEMFIVINNTEIDANNVYHAVELVGISMNLPIVSKRSADF